MRTIYSLFFSIQVILFTMFITSGSVLAAPVELNVPGDYPSIDSALVNAASLLLAHPENTYSILVEPSSGHYSAPAGGFILKSGISIRGKETARTIIDGNGGVAVTAIGVTGVSFKNFTITNASTGISVSGNSAVTIENNVFADITNTAVMIQTSAASSVINNTFYQNGIAISRDTDSGAAITNNIFYNSANTVKIVQNGIIAETTITYNLFSPQVNGPKGTNYIPNLIITNADPLFVNAANLDFHIRSNPTATSPCINNGDPTIHDTAFALTDISDIGAYGGPEMDTIPNLVSGVTATLATTDSASVTWSQNTSYVVNEVNPFDHVTTGGYHVYYGLISGLTVSYPNMLTIASTSTSTVISGLTTTASPPAAPTINPLGFDNQTLNVSWSPVSGATSYNVYYLETGTTNTQQRTTQATSYKIDGLVNGTDYTVWVTAVTQPALYLAVTAFDYAGPYDPGFSHESDYSPEIKILLGSAVEGAPSSNVFGFPEAYVYNPNLPNKGCFIATAAYGYYDAPQVQALRDFRDRYLETNSAGRAFVAWYYQYGPIGAAALNKHPWLKPVARAALMPAVGGALFLTRTSSATQLLALLLFCLITALLVLYKKSVKRGGSR